ncbi:acyl carrier protein [Kitasatospora sp. NPDC058184]|uniref:acyl carrier protein n=1 Tax=Kitasatospora sp. NPDC058184 TaxID=3346370 RepID=UPI0036DBF824
MTTIEERIISHISEKLGPGHDIAADTDLSYVLDSTAVMEVVVWIEEAFGFSAELDEINPDTFGSPARLAQWVRRNVEGAAT